MELLECARRPTRILVHHADTAVDYRPNGLAGRWQELTTEGHVAADLLAQRLAGHSVRRILSSPSLRCLQTVAPLAQRARLKVEPTTALDAGADPDRAARLLVAGDTIDAVLCTHPDVLLGIFGQVAHAGCRLVDGIEHLGAGATAWTMHGGGGVPLRLRHLSGAGHPMPR